MNSERPNLLVIQTDQQSCWTLGAYGGRVGTPRRGIGEASNRWKRNR